MKEMIEHPNLRRIDRFTLRTQDARLFYSAIGFEKAEVEHRKVLLIHRIREDREYWVLPGGSVEHWESPEEACCRGAAEQRHRVVARPSQPL